MKNNQVRKNIKKRLLKAFVYTLLVLLFLPPAVSFLFHAQLVQTLAARVAATMLSSRIGNTASIDLIRIGIRKGIIIEGLVLKDHKDSILMQVDELNARPVYADWGLFGIVFSRVELDGVIFRIARYEEDDEINIQLLINKFRPDSLQEQNQGKPSDFKIRMRKMMLRNARFQYYDEQREFDLQSDMDYANIIFDSIFLDASNFVIHNDSLNFRINKLLTTERSGIRITDMQTDFTISSTGLWADSLKIKMNNTNLDLDFSFNYSSYQSYNYFIDSVVIYADIRPSEVLMSDIGFFANVMKKMTNNVGITGKVYGTISRFNGDDVRLHYKNQTRISIDAEVQGLPDFYNSRIRANLNEIRTTSCELKSLSLPIPGGHLDFTDVTECNKPITLSGNFDGFYNNFKSDFVLNTSEGDLVADLAFTKNESDTLYFDLHAKGDSVSIGKILDQKELLGNLKFDLNAKGRGNSWSDMKIKSTGTLRSFDFNDYRYSRIRYTGRYSEKRVESSIVVGDRNLMMSADVVALLNRVPELGIVAKIRKANLDKLNFWQGYDFAISTEHAVLKMKGLQPDSLNGKLLLDNSTLFFGNDQYALKKAEIDKKHTTDGFSTISVTSDFADLKLTGNYNVTTLGDQLINLLNHYLDVIPLPDTIKIEPAGNSQLSLTLYDDALIRNHFVPGLNIAPDTELKAFSDFKSKRLSLKTNIKKLDLGGVVLLNNIIDVDTKQDELILKYSNQNTILKDSTSTSKTVFGFDNFEFNANIQNNNLNYSIYWNNVDSIRKNSADIIGYYRKSDTAEQLKIVRSEIVINDTLWTIDPANMLLIDSTGAHFENLNIYGGQSEMKISGMIPRRDGDSMMVYFDTWRLSNFDMVTKLWRFDLDGTINGGFQYSLLNNNPIISSDIRIDNLAMNKEYLGFADLVNIWDNQNKSLNTNANVTRIGDSGEGKVISIQGQYYPFSDDNSLNYNIAFNRLKIGALESFFVDFISQLEGVAAGEMKLTGTPSQPVLTGYLDMHRTQLLINYLNTKYSFSNVIQFEKDRISFDELVIYDTLGNFANVDGNLRHEYFQNTAFDVNVSTNKLLVFNTSSKMNELYYGTGLVSGSLKLGGNAKKVLIDMNLSTLAGTDVKLPLDYSIETSDKDYIIFVDHTDTTDLLLLDDQEMEEKEEEDELEYAINMDVNVNPQARVTIYLPSEMGRIESEGTGKLKMSTNTDGDFNLVGDYRVSDGLFHFSLANLVSKRFDLMEGGRISWTGDPYGANLNIKGLYRVRTNLSSLGLVIDTTADFRNKVNVNCYVILKNKLLNPDIRFEIMFPELNPDIKRQIYAELDTTNQAMMNEQMISLLVLGTFSYSNAANINLGTAAYYSVLTNQLSSMLSKISDDFDIGVNYKPGDNVTQEEFEVALSTQLFDDRLMIDGNFGMTYDRSGQNASSIVGDVDLGYKITEDGQWILKAFNHSNVNSWYYYDNVSPYTQGVGVAFRKEFTNISELFKRTKPRKNESKTKNNTDAIKED